MMKILSISDLHLSDGNKPMDIFGVHWYMHFSKICQDWTAQVSPDDVVLLPGDLSWAMQLDDALDHIKLLGDLPGRKVIIKGNHDFWWSSVSRLRDRLPEGVYAIQNDCVALEGVLIAGSRGWMLPGPDSAKSDIKIFDRELIRLEMSLKSARNVSNTRPLFCMSHYPPLTASGADTPVTKLLEMYGVNFAVYGHLHGQSLKSAFNGVKNSIEYKCTSCDGLDFKLAHIADI